MNILDLSSDLMQLDGLMGDTASISKALTIIIIIMTIGTIVILPIFMYLKYLMDVKIVKKGTLQALNEFYGKQQTNNTNKTIQVNNALPINNSVPVNSIDNSNTEQHL